MTRLLPKKKPHLSSRYALSLLLLLCVEVVCSLGHSYGDFGHTCVIISGNHVRCWRGNNFGQLGYGHTDNIGDDEPSASAGVVGATVMKLW